MLTEERRNELLERYREGPRVIEAALRELSPEQMDNSHEGWTPRQVIHHVADSEMTSAIRLRRLIAEDRPRIEGYDQELFAKELYYGERPVEASLTAISGARASSASLLDCLTPEQWRREGTHSELGAYSVERWLEVYTDHCHDHADQIRRAAQQP
ncbi:MAG: DinB family protein [Candidatus Dormibacteraeota bacterium]|nr:DinB family protein [Candidatus Dormibacteraeota bacterium]